MSSLSRLRSLWRNLIHRDRLERDLDDELRATFEGLVDEHLAAGMDPARARRAATLALGRVDSIKTQVRDARAGHGVETVWHDVRFGARMLRRSPLFTLAAVLSLGIGIGANTTIFSVVNAVLLRDLRVANPRALVEIWRTTQFGSGTAFSYPAYEQLRDENQVFEGVIALSKSTVAGHAGETAAPLSGRYVSGNFFEVLGVTPLAGRLISARDDRADAPEGAAIAVVSQRISERAFGGSAGALGRTIRVDAVAFTVVGVLPPTFADAVVGRPADFFIPMASEPLIRRDSRLRSAPTNWLGILGRLRPDVTSERAAANLAPIFARFMAEVAAPMPDAEARQRLQAQRLFLQPGSGGTSDVRRDVSRPLWLLMGAVSLVLLIACANVINLLLARGVARRREIGVRLAIGASRQRLVRQLLTESALLGIAGAALGMAIAFVGAPLIVWLVSEGGSRLDVNVTPDGRILLFTVTLAVASSLAAGVLPALRTARSDITPSFAGGARSLAMTPESARWGKALIAAQVALSLLLVIGAALLAETLRRIRAVDPGFEAGHVILFTLDPTRVGYSEERLAQYYRDVLDSTRTVAGVQAASVSKITPMSGGGIDLPIAIEGRQREPGVMVYVNRISDGFFATMAVPLLLGRDLVPQDGSPGNAVAIVNEALAQRYFGGENPIGRRITLGNQHALEIVGLAANSKYYTLREVVRPTVYIYGLNIGDPGGFTLSVRTSAHPLALANQIRERVQSIAATVPVSEGRSLSSQVERSLGTERLVARLLGAFAAVALLLAAVGLYGVLGYHVVRRTGEIGLRLALGASRRAVLGSVLRQSMTVVAIGSAIGIPASMMLSRPLGGLLYGVTPSDPAVLSGAVACLFLVALAAAAVPAWRAASVDPLVALRHQ